MCIRDRVRPYAEHFYRDGAALITLDAARFMPTVKSLNYICLLYTSDAADERSSVDLGGRRIIKKKTNKRHMSYAHT